MVLEPSDAAPSFGANGPVVANGGDLVLQPPPRRISATRAKWNAVHLREHRPARRLLGPAVRHLRI